MSNPHPETHKNKNIGWLNLATWILIAVLIRWQVVEPRWIPSGSMLPTLRLKDKVLIEKVRPRLLRLQGKSLQDETIVVFRPPLNLVEAGYDQNSALIKRVVGTQGETIAVHNGQLIRNGIIVKEPWLPEPIEYEMESVTIQENELWVLGDNRNNSLDSHLWGALPDENVIGTAVWRYWPLQAFGPIRFPTLKKYSDRPLLR